MNLTDITKTLGSSLGSIAASKAEGGNKKSVTQANAIDRALTQASARVEQQLQKSEVKLSSLGQVKSAVAELQSASKTLSADKTGENVTNAKQAAQGFVTAFNNANSTLNKAINGEGRAPGTLADEGRTRIAANELSRAINSTPSTASELKAIGITTERNGTLKIDTQKFEQAFQNNPGQVTEALSRAGQQVERTASRQIENNGNVARSINSLSNQVRALETQQANQQNLVDTLQRATEDAGNRLNATKAAGIAEYQKIFNL